MERAHVSNAKRIKHKVTTPVRIPFNKPYMTGKELSNIAQAHFESKLSGDGPFTEKCHRWIEEQTGSQKALLTHSCTAALEMCALLLNLQTGDEVIMPSFTFVSTANAFVLRGAVPVFVDIRYDTGNIDESLIESAITPRTRAIVVVHYAGVACEMDSILRLAERHGLTVIEDAAQAVMSFYKGRALGCLGQLGTFSFHETKNVISGEGGALLVNDAVWVQPAEIIREKGTDRARFLKGAADKYTWQSLGSSFLPGEITAAFLYAQFEHAREITEKRMHLWQLYYAALGAFEARGVLRRPVVPTDCKHNAHMFYILVENEVVRAELLEKFKGAGIGAIPHYVPLHDSPAGLRLGRACGDLPLTKRFASCLVRLPMWIGISDSELTEVLEVISEYFR
jgi:dTDP-4-amino-4,6-dideoxygalactose transaminase